MNLSFDEDVEFKNIYFQDCKKGQMTKDKQKKIHSEIMKVLRDNRLHLDISNLDA